MTINLNGTEVDPASLPHEIIYDISPYGYLPTKWVCYTFVVLFGVTTGVHLIQALWKRTYWFLLTAVLCGIGECIGWAGRLWSFYNVLSRDAYMMQLSASIISPTPLLAVNFVMLGRFISLLGPHYGLLPPKYYSAVFISSDISALIVQAVGGGIASSDDDPTRGAHIMLGGIAFQFAVMVIYSILAVDFFWRWKHDKPYRRAASSTTSEDGHIEFSSDEIQAKEKADSVAADYARSIQFKLLVGALSLTTLLLFIRAIYRLIELSEDWRTGIIVTEKWFNAFDGLMVLLAMFAFNIVHPAVFFPAQRSYQTSKA